MCLLKKNIFEKKYFEYQVLGTYIYVYFYAVIVLGKDFVFETIIGCCVI